MPRRDTTKVAVIGAGVAGLTAAHELACRGYAVTVFEAGGRDRFGGKCRTQYTSHPTLGRLPGEHGFRFFPSWYAHVPDSMRRIPLDTDADTAGALEPYAESVFDRLTPSRALGFAYPGHPVRELPLGPTRALASAAKLGFEIVRNVLPTNRRDAAFIGRRFFGYMTLCERRRDLSYDNVSLWDFFKAHELQPDTRDMLMRVPRSLVAMDAKQGNVRTFLNTLFLMGMDGASKDAQRVLQAPTTDAWIAPWVAWLEHLGVSFVTDARLAGITHDPVGKRVTGITIDGEGGARTIDGFDHYVVAVPLDRLHPLVDPTLAGSCAQLGRIHRLNPAGCYGRVTGVQIYLDRDIPIMRGHIGFPSSPWGLTAVSQRQFWGDGHLPAGVGGVISVCVSDFDQPDFAQGAPIMDLDDDAIAAGVITQIRDCLDARKERFITEHERVIAHHVDVDLRSDPPQSHIFINRPGQLQWRPETASDLTNLVFAGDWVQNPVDLATMEGASAAARMAVNVILTRDGATARRCLVERDRRQRLEAPYFGDFKAADERRLARGKSSFWLDDDTPAMDRARDDDALLEHFEGYLGELASADEGPDMGGA